MLRFIGKAALFAGLLAIPYACYCAWLSSQAVPPPPSITGSMSFDEKARFIRERNGEAVDLLVVGSSLAVNNIASEVLMREAPCYLNAGAWGLTIGDVREYLRCLLGYCHPKVLVLTASPAFFQDKRTIALSPRYESYIRGELRALPFVYWNCRRILRWQAMAQNRRAGRDDQKSLLFDRGGGVPVRHRHWMTEAQMWRRVPELRADPSTFLVLGQVARMAREHGVVRVVVVGTPMRRAALNDGSWRQLAEYTRALGNSCTAYGIEHVELQHGFPQKDENFVDSLHLSDLGAVVATELLAEELRRRGVLPLGTAAPAELACKPCPEPSHGVPCLTR